jgi:hypothetical protein
MNDFTGTPVDGGPAAQEGGTQQARTKTSHAPPRPDPILLTFTGRKSGGFIGKKLLGNGIETCCGGVDFVDEVVACLDFSGVEQVIGERAKTGHWSITQGAPVRSPSGPHKHEAADYHDTPTRLFFVDVDGFFAKGLGRAQKFDDAARHVLSRMGTAFRGVTWLTLRTTRTGSDPNRIFMRLLFLLQEPATLVQMGAVAEAMKTVSGFEPYVLNKKLKKVIDPLLYKEGRFVFIASPQCEKGVPDPASAVEPVLFESKPLDLAAAAKALGVDLANVSPKRGVGRPAGGAGRRAGAAGIDHKRASPFTPGPRNQELLTALVNAIPNDGKFDARDRSDAGEGEGSYIGMGHSIWGACSTEPLAFGESLWMGWAGKWESGTADPSKDADAWRGFSPTGKNGFWSLMDYAREFGGDEGRKARAEIFCELLPAMSADQLDNLARTFAGELPDWLREMNAKYAFIMDRPGGVLVRGGDKQNVVRMLTLAEFRNQHLNKPVPVVVGRNRDASDKIAMRNMADAWLKHRARAEYATADDYPVGRQPRGALNLWTGLAVASKRGKWPVLKAYLFGVVCNGDQRVYAYFLKLVQWKIQNPTENPEVGLVLLGGQGVGKGTLVEILARVFGLKRVTIYSAADAATSKFNADAEGKLLLFFDECHFGHDHHAKGKLKGDITGRTQRIEHKGLNAYHVKNTPLRVYSSNAIAALPLDHDDRRFLVLEVSARHTNDVAYYAALWKALDGGELAAFVHDALATDLTAFDLDRRVAYRTEARTKLAAATASPEDDYLLALLERGGPVEPTGWNARPYKQNTHYSKNPWLSGDILLPRGAIHLDYVRFVQNNHRAAKTRNAAELYAKIGRVLGVRLFRSEQVRLPGTARREQMRFVGSLKECRDAYDAHGGTKHEWDDIPTSPRLKPPVRPKLKPLGNGLYRGNDGLIYDAKGREAI